MTLTVLRLPAGAARGGNPARVAVAGKVGASNASRLRLAILDAGAGHGAQVDVDPPGVTFIDSSGLKAVTGRFPRIGPSGSGLVLRNVSRQVRRILEITDIGRTVKVRR